MRRHWLIIPLAFLLLAVGPVAYAQGEPEWRSWPMGDRFGINVGTFFANRRTRESESLIGMILNNVVIRAALDTNPTGRQLMISDAAPES